MTSVQLPLQDALHTCKDSPAGGELYAGRFAGEDLFLLMPARSGSDGISAHGSTKALGALVTLEVISAFAVPFVFSRNSDIIRFDTAVSGDDRKTEAKTFWSADAFCEVDLPVQWRPNLPISVSPIVS